ncbi:hypothetical protein RAD15_39250 [Bradyrhizobium sp. 14AA]
MSVFTKIILFTDSDGRARFREENIDLSEGSPLSRLSPPVACSSYRLRKSPADFSYDFHCMGSACWIIILGGQMEIILQDGSSRIFKPGDCFYAADVLPAGAVFDKKVHGHASRGAGPDPLVTMFVAE